MPNVLLEYKHLRAYLVLVVICFNSTQGNISDDDISEFLYGLNTNIDLDKLDNISAPEKRHEKIQQKTTNKADTTAKKLNTNNKSDKNNGILNKNTTPPNKKGKGNTNKNQKSKTEKQNNPQHEISTNKKSQNEPKQNNESKQDVKTSTEQQNNDADINLLELKMLENFKMDNIQNGISTGLVGLYKHMKNMILHPLLIVVLVIQTLILLVTLLQIYIKLKQKAHLNNILSLIMLAYVYLIFAIDWIFIIYENSQTYSSILMYNKDMILTFISCYTGFILGKHWVVNIMKTERIP